jgi:hypothetical protein
MQRNTSFLKKLIYVQNHIRKYSKPKEKEIQKHRAVVVGKHSEASPTAPQSSNDKTPSKVASFQAGTVVFDSISGPRKGSHPA